MHATNEEHVTVGARVSRRQHELLKDAAWRRRQSLSDLIRQQLEPIMNGDPEVETTGKAG